MKIIKYLVFIFMGLESPSYAQEWISFQGYPQTQVVQQYVQVYQPQPFLVYQLTPVVVQQNIIVEQKYLFCKKQTIITQPVTQWVYQPVIVYK